MGAASLGACSLGLADGCTANESCAPDATTSDAADAAAADSIADTPRFGEGDSTGDQSLLDSAVDSATADAGADASPDVADVEICDPSAAPHDEPCVLSEAYGVFVASAAVIDAGLDASAGGSPNPGSEDGSMQQPYRSIGQALANMGSRTRLYVCNGLYNEQVTITSPVAIYGGLSCSAVDGGLSWSYVGGNAQVIAPTPEHALAVTGVGLLQDAGVDATDGEAGMGASVTIEDMAFVSPSATPAGSSSIAAFVTSSSVQLVRVTLTAGRGADGAPGADGTTNPNYSGAAPDGGPQNLDSNGYGISGGAGGVNTCLLFGDSAGGDGGAGCSVGAGFATPGTSRPIAPVTMSGRDGLPRGTVLSDGGTILVDDPGADGLPGDGGMGADGASGDAGTAAPGYGMLSSTRWTPSAGSDGALGNPGQGGAGGSDPLANTNCSTPVTSIGGGGGGAGGCGGAGGKGGLGGGASIALAIVASAVDLRSCVLSTGAGGTGGAGGSGQDGQSGGAGGDDGNTSYVHAPGAPGGNGAGGSGGFGGTGGISVGVLYEGSVVTYDDATQLNITIGPPGAGGAAGPAGRHATGGALSTGYDGNPGAPGTAGLATAILSLM
jgi:hypothetical protein